MNNIYRYKLHNDIINLLKNFTEINMFTEKKIFKENWNNFLVINKTMIENEKERLRRLGYAGNIENKMYISARYYLKNKDKIDEKKKKIKEYSSKEKNYINLSSTLLQIIKNDICNNENIKPSIKYNNFKKNYNNEIEEEIKRLLNLKINILNNDKECENKIKKTYKNICFTEGK